LKKPAIILAHFPRFFESASAFAVEATEVALDILDVTFEVATDDVRIVPHRLRIARKEGTGRRDASLGMACDRSEHKSEQYSQR
jgi:hypothetical protein